jgi:hypothetical protein
LLYPIENTLKTINFTIMRTSQICPTCTTYINSLCIVYNGTYLSNINASPLDDLDTILSNINTATGVINSSVASINTSITALNGVVALKESSSNKSTDGTFNSGSPSTTLFPTQSAVATYIASIPSSGWGLTGNSGTVPGTNFIGTTDAQDVVFKASGVEFFKLSVADQNLLLSKSVTCNSTSTTEIAVRSTAGPTNGFVAINQNATDKGNVQINNGDGTTKIKTLASATTRVVSFPNADGTIALVNTSAFTGTRVIGGETYSWVNGILISVV